jgi:hypothetical protein
LSPLPDSCPSPTNAYTGYQYCTSSHPPCPKDAAVRMTVAPVISCPNPRSTSRLTHPTPSTPDFLVPQSCTPEFAGLQLCCPDFHGLLRNEGLLSVFPFICLTVKREPVTMLSFCLLWFNHHASTYDFLLIV